MQVWKLNFTRIATTALLCLFSLAPNSMAASKRLNYPYGLTVDAKGNLYVANTNGNEVLVYNANHAQVANKTITKNVVFPTAVAFDANGDLWVSNAGNPPANPASITEYSSTGVQNTNATLTTGLSQPNAIAIDGLADIWVQDSYSTIIVYAEFQSVPLVSLPAGIAITGFATHQAYLAVGTNSNSYLVEMSPFLHGKLGGNAVTPTCFAMAYDTAGNLYCGNQDQTLTVLDPSGNLKTLASIGFFPTGLALDNVRGFVYVADGPGNSIAVYNTSGTLLTTIK
jgi:DNA-binding beta-propeller fold protein YncE